MDIESSYFNNSKFWYIRTYLQPVRERLFYFILFFISVINIFLVILIMLNKDDFQKKMYIVAYLNRVDKSSTTIVHKINPFNMTLDIIKYATEKFITNCESLVFEEHTEDIIAKKLNSLKDALPQELQSKFEKEFYSEEKMSDFSFVIQNGQKVASVEKIMFEYEKKNVVYHWFNELFDLNFGQKILHALVKVENDLFDEDQYFLIDIEYDIFIPLKFRKKTEESKIFFKILSYDKTGISQEEFEYLLKK